MNDLQNFQGADLGDIDPSDIRVQRLTLAQGAGKSRPDGVSDGEWFLDQSQTNLGKEIQLIPIQMFKTRILWGAELGDPARCFSNDARVPANAAPIGPHGESAAESCAACSWSRRPSQGEDWKSCNQFTNFFGLAGSGEEPEWQICVLPLSRTKLPLAGKIINTTLFSASDPNKVAYFHRSFKIGSQRKTGDKFSYLVPSVLSWRTTTDEEQAMAYKRLALWKQIVGTVRESTMSAAAAGDGVTGGEEHVGAPMGGDDDDSIPF